MRIRLPYSEGRKPMSSTHVDRCAKPLVPHPSHFKLGTAPFTGTTRPLPHEDHPMSAITPYLSDWTTWMEVQNYSPATVQGYTYQIKDFDRYLTVKTIKDVRQVSAEVMRGYKLNLLYRYPDGFWSVTAKMRAVHSLFAFLTKTKQVIVDPSADLKPPRIKRLPRNILSTDEAKLILDQPDLSKPNGVVDRAILETLYATGVRVGEVQRMSIHDLDTKNGVLLVHGKGGKDRTVPLGAHALRFLEAYLTEVRPRYASRSAEPCDALWLGNAGRPLSRQIIARRVRRHGRKAKVQTKKVSPHVWRHTFATSLVRGGADIRHVQEFLGHSQTSSTLVYTKVTGADIKDAHSACYPDKPEPAFPKIRARSSGRR